MSQLLSVMEEERLAERGRAVRQLLASPLLLATQNPEVFGAVLRNREWLVSWFAEHAGWKLTVDASGGFARLYKLPGGPDTSRAAHAPGRPDFDRRRYALFCLTLAAFDEVGAQTTLANLARRVEELSADEEAVEPFEPTSGAQRRAFVDALRLLVHLGVLTRRDGDEERYARTEEGDALFDVNERVLSHLISAPVPPAFAGSPDKLLEDGLPDTEEGQRQRNRHATLRRLLDDPVLYFDELEPSARDWVEHSRGYLYRLLKEAGFTVERRAEGLAAIDASGMTADILFPDGNSTVKHAALLLAEQFTRLHRQGEAGITGAEAARLMRKLHADHGESCQWSKQYPGNDDGCERLAADALQLLEAFRLVSRQEDGWRFRAAIARFRPGIPARRTRSGSASRSS